MAKFGLILGVVLLINSQPASAERDPFAPYVSPDASATKAASAPVVKRDTSTPNIVQLDKYALSSYSLIGIIVSPDTSIAVVRGPDQQEYYVTVGDQLGKEGGVIEEVTIDRMVVENKDDVITLQVSNKVIQEATGAGAR